MVVYEKVYQDLSRIPFNYLGMTKMTDFLFIKSKNEFNEMMKQWIVLNQNFRQ